MQTKTVGFRVMFSASKTESCKYLPIKFHCLLLLFPSVYTLLGNKRKTAIQNHLKFDNERVSNTCLPIAVICVYGGDELLIQGISRRVSLQNLVHELR
jgi:hypothetical protein